MKKMNTAEKAVFNNSEPASIDYRLRARSVVKAVKQGSIYKSDVCDAHPTLLKIAKAAGEPCSQSCSICEADTLVTVCYLFGAKLGPSGRCIADFSELQYILQTKKGIFTCYVVEVCTSCSWNFLIQNFPIHSKI